jgi:hypothetical protein
MRLRTCLPIATALALSAASPAARAGDAAHPTVVELFQSQGCSSCPPANANLLALAGRPDVLALSWQVTYWDYLGWKDTFARPEFTARQWDYARAFHRREVATPQVVVDGRRDAVGADLRELRRLIDGSGRGSGGPQVRLSSARASIGAGRGSGVVWLVRYDPRIVEVPIRRGENGGRTLPHRNVVRDLVRLGGWRGAATAFDLPAPSRPGLKTAVLVQAGPGGPILAAARD